MGGGVVRLSVQERLRRCVSWIWCGRPGVDTSGLVISVSLWSGNVWGVFRLILSCWAIVGVVGICLHC